MNPTNINVLWILSPPLLFLAQFAGEATLNVTTDTNGNTPFNFTLPEPVSAGRYITSTATLLYDLDRDPQTPFVLLETSEFSAGITVIGEGGSPCPQPYPDFNEDQFVDAIDLLLMIQGVRDGDILYDLTEDSMTNKRDLAEFNFSWLRPDCGAPKRSVKADGMD